MVDCSLLKDSSSRGKGLEASMVTSEKVQTGYRQVFLSGEEMVLGCSYSTIDILNTRTAQNKMKSSLFYISRILKLKS